MEIHRNKKVIFTLLGIILVGGLFLAYLKFLDGTFVNPVLSSLAPRQYITTQKTYNPGDDVVVYSSAFCKYRAVSATVTWNLEDDVLLSYPPKNTDFANICYDSSKLIDIGVLPDYIGGHNYHFVGQVTYHLFDRDITVNLSTADFFVNASPTTVVKTVVVKVPSSDVTAPQIIQQTTTSTTVPQNSTTPPVTIPTQTAPQSQNTSTSNANPQPPVTEPVQPKTITIPIVNIKIPLPL